jgi:hypothetical protein
LSAAVLSGAVHGTYAIGHARHDSTRSIQLAGSGTIQSLGRVRVDGSIQETTGGRSGQNVGRLALANEKGRVMLQLDATPRASGASGSEDLAFVVQGGNGSYRGLAGSGVIVLSLGSPIRGRFTLALQSAQGSAGGGAVQPPPTIVSGIRGVALEGPIAPVERPGEPNSQPLPGAIITVQPAGGGPVLAQQQADATGNFQIALDPGSYLIVPLPPQPGDVFPRGTPQMVTVAPNQVADVTVNYDTGIR